LGEGAGYEEVLFRAMQIPVVLGTRYGAMPFAERHANRTGKSVIRLGTKAGNEAIFSPAELPPADLEGLKDLLGREGVDVVPTRFAPASLPVVLAPDRDVALKRRVEREEADRRISSAILTMARMFTEKIDGSVGARLFVNLDSPVIQRLIEGDGPRIEHAAAIVRAMADLFTDRREEDALRVDTGGAFAALSQALVALLD
jgi:molecular chaperone HtpG